MGLPRKIKNFTLFNEGLSYLGEVDEVTLPKLTRKTEDWRAGGMGGPIKADMGMEGLEMSWTSAGYIRTLLGQLGFADPRQLMRTKEDLYKELGLADVNGDALIRAMHQHPKLIERPIVIKNGQARIGRPPELVLEILK